MTFYGHKLLQFLGPADQHFHCAIVLMANQGVNHVGTGLKGLLSLTLNTFFMLLFFFFFQNLFDFFTFATAWQYT